MCCESCQPLLDVDHTSARLNLLTPRYVNQKGVALPTSSALTRRAKRENLQQKQILIPELCDVHPFPASLWRKAVCLPAMVYRMNCLLVAEELRRCIAVEAHIGCVEGKLNEFDSCPPLRFGFCDVSQTCAKQQEESISCSSHHQSSDSDKLDSEQIDGLLQTLGDVPISSSDNTDVIRSSSNCEKCASCCCSHLNQLDNNCFHCYCNNVCHHDVTSSTDTRESTKLLLDIKCTKTTVADTKNMNGITNLAYTDSTSPGCCCTALDKNALDSASINNSSDCRTEDCVCETCDETAFQSCSFSLDANTSSGGPSPCDVLQALTMSNANDFFNLERLETIGDSFLKFAISIYLYCMYPGIHEGKLSYLRSIQVDLRFFFVISVVFVWRWIFGNSIGSLAVIV